MTLYKNKYRVETTRLKVWDYSNPWWYFVTINTKNHECYFGNVVNDLMELNQIGEKAKEHWNDIPKHYPFVELDYYVVMPNHVHGIIIINKTVETRHASSLQHMKVTLSDIIGSYKSAVSKYAHSNNAKLFKWQPSFYDRIIRNEKELYKIRKYIDENPLQWELEKKSPENLEII